MGVDIFNQSITKHFVKISTTALHYILLQDGLVSIFHIALAQYVKQVVAKILNHSEQI